MNPKVSIVIPTYNVEKYLKRCIESIINQTLDEIEIIIVNDGSTDMSGKIADELSKIDSRIIIINQENKGLSGARNTGLNAARGEYIAFIDADDWIEMQAIETMYKYAKDNDCEVVQCNHKIVKNNTVENISNEIPVYKVLNEEEIEIYLKGQLIQGKLRTYAWDKIYKLSFLKDNNLYFQDIQRFEDWYFFIEIISKVKRFLVVENCFYNYWMEEGSLSRRYYSNYENLVLDIHNKKLEYMLNWNLNTKLYKSKYIISLYEDVIKLINNIFDRNHKLDKNTQLLKLNTIINSRLIRANFNKENNNIYIKNTTINSLYLNPILYGIKYKNKKLIYIWVKMYRLIKEM